jgi:hypothetical protein
MGSAGRSRRTSAACDASSLQVIGLSNNHAFNGELPANLSSCTNLVAVAVTRLRFNQLEGPVPSELADKLTHLKRLDLRNNSHTPTVVPSRPRWPVCHR